MFFANSMLCLQNALPNTATNSAAQLRGSVHLLESSTPPTQSITPPAAQLGQELQAHQTTYHSSLGPIINVNYTTDIQGYVVSSNYWGMRRHGINASRSACRPAVMACKSMG
jgi:hypothetical protein